MSIFAQNYTIKTMLLKKLIITATLTASLLTTASASTGTGYIDRKALVERNNPVVTGIDTLASLTVGNGGFAFTTDVTGLQTFHPTYRNGVPLGTQSDWGWHSFPNPQGLKHSETLRDYDFGRGRQEPYSVQFNEEGRQRDAAEWYRVNPHRLHLGAIGFEGLKEDDIKDARQTLDMWNGEIRSHFTAGSAGRFDVVTWCDPERDMVCADIENAGRTPVMIKMPYPTGKHSDDGCDWNQDDRHQTEILNQDNGYALLSHRLDATEYYVSVTWNGPVRLEQTGRNTLRLFPESDKWSFTAEFTSEKPERRHEAALNEGREKTHKYWNSFWTNGGAVDFSRCTDPRARELERRVVLSQYLLAVQCAGTTPPQETGLTYNSWFGKFHLEMIWWHQAQFALWGRGEMLGRTLPWYSQAEKRARGIAVRQGFKGIRWMKMTDPDAEEAPSKVGSFLIWQQPHLIYLAELLYRTTPTEEGKKQITDRYGDLVEKTAEFMADFSDRDENGRFVLKGVIPAQETLRAAETVNPPFELSYWHFALQAAQQWRERRGAERSQEWDEVIERLSPLAKGSEGLYLAAETAPETYKDIRFTSDHMAVLAALGILPKCGLVEEETMEATLNWIMDNWNWDKTWGWDYPTTAMCAVRLGQPEKALQALLMDKRTNTYLPNGHNYQDGRLRCYLPGNGGLLTAVALMTAGWDGCDEVNPGFPKDGKWDVVWEGINPLP